MSEWVCYMLACMFSPRCVCSPSVSVDAEFVNPHDLNEEK